MKHIVRWGLVTLIFAVALVFFGSVICPPIAEREAESVDSEAQYPLQEDAGTYKPLPGELQIEDRFPVAQDLPTAATDSLSTVEVTVMDENGIPVSDARVDFLSKRNGGYAAHSWGPTDDTGRFTSSALFDGRYEVRVSHSQYFVTISDPLELPSENQTQLEIRLSPAATVSGFIHTAAGRPVVHGEIRITDLTSGESFPASIQTGGAFRSPPLNPGHWSLSWSATAGGTPESNMRFALPLEISQERKFRIVIPNKHPNQKSDYDVGIQDYLN